MSEQIREIGSRMRELREIAGVSLEMLANEFNIPAEIYTDYENGARDIPVSLLYRIALKFNVDLTEILTGEAPRLHSYCLVRKGRGVSVERRSQYKYQSLAYNFLHKKAEPFLVTALPDLDESTPQLNSHAGQEFIYLIEGNLKAFVGKYELELNEGDSLFFDAIQDHAVKTLGGNPAKFLAIII
jgi:transcriptional regulator with XRE-family HTH domain